MSKSTTVNPLVNEHSGSFLTASVALALYILIFEVITTSRNMALAFNIPNQYVGIYFDKVFALSNSFTTIGSAIDIAIYYIVGKLKSECNDGVRKIISVVFLFLMFICRILFVIILYKSRSMSYHFYILFSFEAFFFGFAQISYFAFAGDFSSANTLAINCSALLAFLVQTILDWIMPSNPLKMLRIHSFICFGLTLFSLGSWPFFLFWFIDEYKKNGQGQNSSDGNGNVLCRKKKSLPEPSNSANGSCSSNRITARSAEQHQSIRSSSYVPSGYPLESLLVISNSHHLGSNQFPNLLYIKELDIIQEIIFELKRICSGCVHMESSVVIRAFISQLELLSTVQKIDEDLLVFLDLIIIGIQKDTCENCMLLRQLSLFLRIKSYMNQSTQALTDTSVIVDDHSNVLSVPGSSGSEEGPKLSRVRRNSGEGSQDCKKPLENFGKSMSRFLMFHIPSFFKDFLFPGVLPFGLLDMNNCKLAIKLVPIFSVLGSLTNYIWSTHDKERDKNWSEKHYDYIWILIIPMIIVYICSLLAIHSKVGFFRAIVNSQWRVIIMMLPLLYFYAFMENVSYSGVAGYVFSCSSPPKYVLETHNLTCMIFRYLFGKLAVGYSNVRIKSGYVLPNFKPVRGLDDTFCYWFCNIFKQAGIDIGKDFRLSIREYL